jgi:hypothetical protein
MSTVLPEPPRSALIDTRSGMLSREWVLFFDALKRAIVSGLDDAVGGRLDALESDSLFASGDGGSGSNTDYNDAVVRGRIDDLETELLWVAADRSNDETDPSEDETDLADLFTPSDSTGAIRRLTSSLAEANLVALMHGDSTAPLRQLKRSIRDLELAQAMATDATAAIAALVHRIQVLETEGAFP